MTTLSFRTSSDDYILYVGVFENHYYNFTYTEVFDDSGKRSITLEKGGYFIVSICKYTDSEGNIKYYLNTPMIVHDSSIFNGTPIDVTFTQTDDNTPITLDKMPASVSLNWIYDITDSIKLPTISDDGTYKCDIYEGYVFGASRTETDSADLYGYEDICVPSYILTDLRKAYGAHYKYRRTISYSVIVILSIIIIVLVLLLTGYYGMHYIKHHHHK